MKPCDIQLLLVYGIVMIIESLGSDTTERLVPEE